MSKWQCSACNDIFESDRTDYTIQDSCPLCKAFYCGDEGCEDYEYPIPITEDEEE